MADFKTQKVASFKKITVLGAGVMGSGIAQVMAQAGFSTCLYDLSPESLSKGETRLRASLDKAVTRQKLRREQAEACLSHLQFSGELAAAVEDADLIVEAVPENLELKKSLFAQLSSLVNKDTVLASNTSSLPISELAQATARPERFLGLHFFNPVPVMPLLEVVRGERTAPDVVNIARELGKEIGKEVVVIRDSPGFATSRLGVAIALEAMRMLEEGVGSAEEIDRAMELGYAHPMGPLKLSDLVGLDVRLGIAEHLREELGERFAPPQILRRMVRAGKVGKKSGEGFYKY